MKKNIVMYAAAVGLAFSVGAVCFGQTPAPQSSVQVKNDGATSGRLVELQITVPGCQTSKVLVKEDAMAKITYHSAKCSYDYGFVPIVHEEDYAHADVIVLRLTEDENGNKSKREVERFPMALGESKTTSTKPKLALKLLAIRDSQSIPL